LSQRGKFGVKGFADILPVKRLDLRLNFIGIRRAREKNIGGETAVGLLVNGDALAITYKDGTAAQSQKETELGITQTLANYGVASGSLQAVDLEVQNQSGWEFWASILLPTLLPLIAIGIFFWLMFRQARTGVNQGQSDVPRRRGPQGSQRGAH